MNAIPELHLPLENLVVWENGFTADELDQIIALGELAEFNKGQIGTGSRATVDNAVRDTDITWLEPSPDTQWVYDRMTQFAARINHDKFQFDLSHFQPFQYGKYQPGGHYTWHTDSGPNFPEHRKLSFVVGLSDPAAYEGGELELNTGGDADKAHGMKIRRGDLVVFPSFVPHRVKPVTSGQRMTLVGWAVGPKFR